MKLAAHTRKGKCIVLGAGVTLNYRREVGSYAEPAQNIVQRIAESSIMISCKECKERLYPDDPSIRIGQYHLSTCEHYCNKPTYYRELEQTKSEIQPIFKPRPVDKEIDQLKAGYIYLQNKLNEHLDKSKQQNKSAF